jgi:hypothetical protein
MRYTNSIDTNLFSFLGLIINRITSLKRNNILEIYSKNSLKVDTIISNNYIEQLYYNYGTIRDNPALQYYYFSLNEDEFVNTYLNEKFLYLNARFEKKIKKVLSEIIANVKMHASPKETAICGYFKENSNEIYLSICNMGLTIKQNIENKTEYIFENDLEAIEWAMKKRNTTRTDTGGLGLYLIRKYIKEIQGEISIISGKGSIIDKRDNSIYSIINEEMNFEKHSLYSFFPGTFITIKFDFLEKELNEVDYTIDIFDLNKMMEDFYGVLNKVSK